MQVLDRTGVGTLWSICKTKFALKDHSHNYLPLSGGTLTGDLLFSNSGTTFRQIRGTCGDNDFWRIGGGATGNNAGYMEIATADDGTEPIYVRQYSGTFSTITRTATLLDGSGNTSFPGTVAAAKFKGALEGNASTASNASTVNGHTVNANVPSNAKFTDTNTWRPIQDNLTSTSTSESLSANQGRVLKGLIDGKANSSHTHSWSQISGAPATATRWPSWGEVTNKPDLKNWSETKSYIDNKAASSGGVDSLPVGTLLQTYNNKNIFSNKWHLADGSLYKEQNSLYDATKAGLVNQSNVEISEDNFGYGGMIYGPFHMKQGCYKIIRSWQEHGYMTESVFVGVYKLNLQTNNYDLISNSELSTGDNYTGYSRNINFNINDLGIVFWLTINDEDYTEIFYSTDFKTFKLFRIYQSGTQFFFINSHTILGGNNNYKITYDINTQQKTELKTNLKFDIRTSDDVANVYFNNKIYSKNFQLDCNTMNYQQTLNTQNYYCIDYDNNILYNGYNDNNVLHVRAQNASGEIVYDKQFQKNEGINSAHSVLKFKDKLIAFGYILPDNVPAYYARKESADTFSVYGSNNKVTYLYDPSYILLPNIKDHYIKIK